MERVAKLKLIQPVAAVRSAMSARHFLVHWRSEPRELRPHGRAPRLACLRHVRPGVSDFDQFLIELVHRALFRGGRRERNAQPPVRHRRGLPPGSGVPICHSNYCDWGNPVNFPVSLIGAEKFPARCKKFAAPCAKIPCLCTTIRHKITPIQRLMRIMKKIPCAQGIWPAQIAAAVRPLPRDARGGGRRRCGRDPLFIPRE